MKKIGKLLAGIIGLGVIVVVGLMVIVKFYLTDERVRDLVVPQAESALGRKVTIGSINVGLFSGISISSFSVKELDGTSQFLSAEQFVIAYKLLPLLQRKVVVSEIKLVQPRVIVKRDKNGQFNSNLEGISGKN
jgi:AsmA protein